MKSKKPFIHLFPLFWFAQFAQMQILQELISQQNIPARVTVSKNALQDLSLKNKICLNS